MPSESATPNRIEWIDNTKGFLLLGVILSHIEFDNCVLKWISLIYMQAFFWVSGLLYSEKRYVSSMSFVKSKTKSLLVPYVLFSLMGFLLDPRYFLMDGIENILFVFIDNVLLFVKGWGTRSTGTLWFIITLWGVNMLYFFFRKSVRHLKIEKVLSVYYAFIMLIMGWLFYRYNWFPLFHIDTVCSASFFFVIAHMSCDMWKNMNLLKCLGICVISFILCIWSILYGGLYAAFFCNNLGSSLFVYVCGSISGAVAIVTASRIFTEINNNKYVLGRIMRYIANNGITFLVIHIYILVIIKTFWQSWRESLLNQLIVLFLIMLLTTMSVPLFEMKLYRMIGKDRPKRSWLECFKFN